MESKILWLISKPKSGNEIDLMPMDMNQTMKKMLCRLDTDPISVPKDLSELIAGGFVAAEGCYFLRSLYEKRGNAKAELFPDETGFECYVNHLHLDDYVDKTNQLPLAFSLLQQLKQVWLRSEYAELPLRIIVSCDDSSCVFRCHVVRPEQQWLSSNIDDYSEATLVTTVVRDC